MIGGWVLEQTIQVERTVHLVQSRQSTDVNRAVGQVLFTGSTANDFYIFGTPDGMSCDK